MKASFLILSIALVIIPKAIFACDACSMYEFSPLQAKSFVGLFYNYSFFNGYKDLGQSPKFAFDANNLRGSNLHIGEVDEESENITPSKSDYEMYQTLDLRLNYNRENKWNFFVNIPLEVNSVYFAAVNSSGGTTSSELYQEQSIGDVLLAAEKVNMFSNDKVKQVLKYGLGLFLPTGNLELLNKEGELNHVSHYTGRGNFELMLRANYSVKLNEKYGTLLLASHTLGTSTQSGDYKYSFGSRLNIQFNGFREFLIKDDLKLIGMLGGYYESIGDDALNKEAISGTGAKSVLGNVSAGVKLKSALLRVEYQLPVWQKEVALQLQNAGRVNVMLMYNL